MTQVADPVAGDVILVAHPPNWTSDPVSTLIQRVTGSEFSHTILCLGGGRYADAQPRTDVEKDDDAGVAPALVPDIATFDDAELEVKIAKPENVGTRLMLLRSLLPVDAVRLDQTVQSYVARAAEPRDPLIFSDGDLAALAVLHVVLRGTEVRSLIPDFGESPSERLRLANAMLFTLEDGDRRLFCSEFVHRALDASGSRPIMPATPFIPLGSLPADEPDRPLLGIMARAESWLPQAENWLRARWEELVDQVLAVVQLDRNTLMTFDEVWDRVREAYDHERIPARLTVANFFTPSDFAASPSFKPNDRPTRVAGSGWKLNA